MSAITRVAARAAIGLVVGLLLMVDATGFAHAKHGHRHWHVHHHAQAVLAQMVAQAAIHLGPMRYYGGPKSPMWRGPATN